MAGKKFRTVHRFGKKRSKANNKNVIGKSNPGKIKKQSSKLDSSSDIAGNLPSTSGASSSTLSFQDTCDKKINTSERKLKYFEKFSTGDGEKRQVPEYRFIDNQFLHNLCTSLFLFCKNCKKYQQPAIKEKYLGSMIWDFKIYCSECDDVHFNFFSSQILKNNNSVKEKKYDLSLRTVLATRQMGIGLSELNTMCAIFNMPAAFHHKTFTRYVKHLDNIVSDVLQEHFSQVSEIVYTEHEKLFGAVTEPLNVTVSYDGSWQKRGHQSHIGIGATVELVTGLVTDIEMLSNYCNGCNYVDADDELWEERHKAVCQKNFTGSSNAMEAEVAKRLWRRSLIPTRNLRYVGFLGDGDSSSFHSVLEEKIYDDVIVIKEECVNHVSKRMGTALRKMVNETKGVGQSMGGRGKLTKERILKLQNYYGAAIRNNTNNLEEMEKAVWASLFHSVSSDDKPHHSYCPEGEESWCFWNRAQANQQPPDRSHRNVLSKEVGGKLIDIYKRLANRELLQRCLQGKTQNSNESLHSKIWTKCPKTQYLSTFSIRLGMALAVIEFNRGYSGLIQVMDALGIPIFVDESFLIKKDKRRIKKSEKESSQTAREKRKTLAIEKIRLEQSQRTNEGSTYSAGGF